MNHLRHPVYLLLLLSLCLATNQAQSSPDCPASDCFRIGTFNLNWLGSTMRGTLPLRSSNEIEQIGDIIHTEANLDIVVLQEINTSLNKTHRDTTYATRPWQQLKQTLATHGYKTQHGESGYSSKLVLAWRSQRIEALIPPFELDVNDAFEFSDSCRSQHLRKPLAGYFRAGGFDFWLVGLHLKSQRKQNACSEAIHSIQIKELLSSLPTLAQKDPDIIIAGDINVTPQHLNLTQLYDAGFINLTTPDSLQKGSATYSYLKGHYRNTIDQLIINHSAQHNWHTNSTFILYASNEQRRYGDYLNTISDHAPVWSSFYIQKQGSTNTVPKDQRH